MNVVTRLTDGASHMDYTCTAQRLKSHGLHMEHTWDTCELQETKRSWAAQQGEEAALRAALRAADAKCPAPVQLAAAHLAEMASLRWAMLLHTHCQTLCKVCDVISPCYCILRLQAYICQGLQTLTGHTLVPRTIPSALWDPSLFAVRTVRHMGLRSLQSHNTTYCFVHDILCVHFGLCIPLDYGLLSWTCPKRSKQCHAGTRYPWLRALQIARRLSVIDYKM